MADGRVLLALADGPLAAAPTWTRYDTLVNCSRIEIDSGRQSEFDVTDTGEATVFFNDTDGTLNDSDLIGLAIQLQVQNPVTDEWVPQFRGVIDDMEFDVNPAGVVSNVQVKCVDLFAYLAEVEMIPGTFGDTVPAGSEGTVFYEDGSVQTRITALLDDAAVPSALYAVFTGNINVLETKYDPGDSVLVAIRDACDAEFPGIANCYIAKPIDDDPLFQFHGRFARFDPDTVSASASGWTFTRWNAGDAAAFALDSTTAEVKAFRFNRPRSRIVNAAISYPRGIAEVDMAGQVSTDSTSITAYGYRSWSAPDLIIKEHKTNGNTGEEECALFASFYTANYAVPRTNVQTITFQACRPDDTRASAIWQLMTEVQISDVINITLADAAVSDEDYYVEGFHMLIEPADGDNYDYVEVTPNLTPAAYYTDDVFNA